MRHINLYNMIRLPKLNRNKTAQVSQMIQSLILIFERIGIDMSCFSDRRLERMACTCLSVGNIKTSFCEATSSDDGVSLRTRDIIKHTNTYFGENMSLGSYDEIGGKTSSPLSNME